MKRDYLRDILQIILSMPEEYKEQVYYFLLGVSCAVIDKNKIKKEN